MRTSRLRFTLCFCVCLPAFGANWYVPSVTNATANGLARVTELRVVNQGTAAVDVQFQAFLAAGQTAPAPVKMTVAAGAPLLVPDVLSSLYGLKESTAGLQISAVQPLLVSARITGTNSAGGAMRASLPVIADDDALATGDAGHFIWVAQSTSLVESFAIELLDPQNTAQITVYDATGKQAGTQTFTGGPQLVTATLRSLVKTDLPLGHAFFVVTAGKAACHLVATDQISGDTTVTSPQSYFEGTTDILIGGAVHNVQSDGQLLRTDLRFYNFSATAAQVTVTPQGATGDGLAAGGTVMLPANGLSEVRDALSTLLAAAGNEITALHFQSDQPVLIVARQTLGLPDGSNGSAGDALPTSEPTDLMAAGAVAELAGVFAPDPTGASPQASTLAFASGPDGATADVTARDTTGMIVAQTTGGALTLPPAGYAEMTLADLFPGVTFSGETIVDVNISAGELAMQQSVIDQTTSDRAIEGAGPVASAYYCLPPGISDFSAYPAAITGAGPVELDWTTDADYVQLTPVNVTMPSEGSMNVTVPATGATYTLQAFNACGSASLTLPVLPLGNAGTLSVTPAAAKPGQEITVNFGQQDLTGIIGVEFEFNGTLLYIAPIDSIDDSGNVMLQVPAIPDPNKPNSILAGAGILRPSIPDNTNLKGPNFTMQPLTYTGDAIAEFRQLIAYITGLAHTNFTALQTAYPTPQDLAAGGALIDQFAQILNKIADDLAARGTATAPVDLPTKEYPTPDTFTVTTADLQDYLAYLHVVAGTNQLTSMMSLPARPRYDSPQGPCVKDTDLFYATCLAFSINPLDGAVKTGADQLWNFVKDALGKLVSKALDAAEYACYLAPLVPQSFRVGPSDFVPPGQSQDKQIIGQLAAYWTKQGLIDSIVAGAETGFKQQYDTDIKKGVPMATAQQRYNAGIAAARKQAQALADVAATNAASIAAERVFGRCELTDVAVAVNFRKNLERQNDNQDPRKYRFKGKRKGDGKLDILIDPTEFVNFHRSGVPHRYDYTLPYHAPISVAQPTRTLRIDQFYAYLSPSERFNLGGLPVTLRDGQGYQGTITIVGNKYLLKVKSLDEGVWRVDLIITRPDTSTPGTPRCMLSYSMQREANANNSQQIEIDMSSSGNAPTTGPLVPSGSTVTIAASAGVNAFANSSSLSVSKGDGASISQQATKLFGFTATSGTVNATIEAKGYNPNIVFSAIIKMQDGPE